MRIALRWILGGLAALMIIVAVGCEGITGQRGDTGDPGEHGPNYQLPTPDNRFFSLAITNNASTNHNGAPKLYLAFDGLHSAASDTVASNRLEDGQVPAIDGIDDGAANWGDKVSNVTLLRGAGNLNGINSVQVRSAWDDDFVYFQFRWSETNDSALGVSVGESDNPKAWVYPTGGTGNPGKWSQTTQNEDRLMVLFEVTPVTRYVSDGCYVTCHAKDSSFNDGDNVATIYYHATRGSRERMDVWQWTAGTTNRTGYSLDRFMDGSQVGVKEDLGTPVLRYNWDFRTVGDDTTANRPLYMAAADPNSNSGYPLWDFQLQRVATSGWNDGATVPFFFNSIPTQSAADLTSAGKFDNGTWTVEMKRKRDTGNGDDTKF